MISEFGFHPPRTHKYAVWMPGYRSCTGLQYVLQLSCLCSFKNKATGKSCSSWITLHPISSGSPNHVGIQRKDDWLPTPSVSSVQSLSRVRLFATPWIAARQASLSITNSRSLLRLVSIESMMPSSHLILCHPLLPPSIFPSIRVFSNELTLHIRWPKYWSFSFNISPSNEYSGLISFRTDCLEMLNNNWQKR